MAKVSIILKKSKTNSKDEHPVLLRLADNTNKRTTFSTGFSATEEQFDTSCGRFVQGRGHANFTVLRKEDGGGIVEYTNKKANDKLTELENRAREIIQRYNESHINWSFEQFRGDYENAPKRESFLAFAEGIVEPDYREKGPKSTADTFKYTIKALKRFDPALVRKTFPEITPKYLERFEAFCKKEGAVPGTISIRMRVIKRIYNIAIREKLVPRESYPFSNGSDDGKYRIPAVKLTKTNKYLTKESLIKLVEAELGKPTMDRDRHLFLFSYYCGGINWIDMAHLTSKNLKWRTTEEGEEGLFIHYQRSKTHGEFDIFVDEYIQAEMDWFKNNTVLFKDYLLPIIIKDVKDDTVEYYVAQKRQRFNANLKRIAIELDLPKSQLNMSSYDARHSVAMSLLNEKVPVEVISQTFGHQSLKTTKHYLAGFSSKKLSELTHLGQSLDAAKKAAAEKAIKETENKRSSENPKEPPVEEVAKPRKKQ